jgi:hypothetical protein
VAQAGTYTDGGGYTPAGGGTSSPAPVTSSPAITVSFSPAPASVVAGSMNTGDFRIVCPVINKAYTGEAYPVPAGAIVEVFPLYGNTKPVRVALYPTGAELGPASSLAPGAVAGRQFPVRNLAEIWVAAEVAGEGVAISIRSK